MGMHGGTCTDFYTGNMVACGSTCIYDKYGIHRTKREIIEPDRNHIGTGAVGKLQKGVS